MSAWVRYHRESLRRVATSYVGESLIWIGSNKNEVSNILPIEKPHNQYIKELFGILSYHCA
jgi:hypothetical protein